MGLRNNRVYYFADPDPVAFDPEDTARTLAEAARYAGNYGHYSVAQHAVLVARLVQKAEGDPPQILAALHHDDSEIVTGDMPDPWKRWLRTRTDVVDEELARINSCIETRYQIDIEDPLVVWADQVVCYYEVQRMVPRNDRWKYKHLPDPGKTVLPFNWFIPWRPEEAYAHYMDIHVKMTNLIANHEPPEEFVVEAN